MSKALQIILGTGEICNEICALQKLYTFIENTILSRIFLELDGVVTNI